MRKEIIFPMFIASSHGGMQRIVLDLMLGLKILGWKCRLVGYANSDLVKVFEDNGIETYTIETPNGVKGYLNFMVSYYKIVYNHRASIIVTNDIFSHIMLSCYPFLKKEVFVSHGGDYKSKGKEFAAKSGRSAKIAKLTFKRVRKFVAVSETQKQALVKNAKVQASRVSVIYNGYDNKNIKKWNVSSVKNVFHISVIGYIKRLKNQGVLFPVIKELQDLGYNCELDLYGSIVDEEYYEELKKHASQLNISNHVKFHGFVSDKDVVYNNSDVVVSCSHHEGFGLTLIEAMAYGIPTIASKKSSGPSSIIKDKLTGILVEDNKSKLYTEAILKYMTDKPFKEFVVQNAKTAFEENFSINVMINKYNTLLNSML